MKVSVRRRHRTNDRQMAPVRTILSSHYASFFASFLLFRTVLSVRRTLSEELNRALNVTRGRNYIVVGKRNEEQKTMEAMR